MSPALESGLTHSFPLYSHSRLLSLPNSLICYLFSHLSLFYGWSWWCELVFQYFRCGHHDVATRQEFGALPNHSIFFFNSKGISHPLESPAHGHERWPATSGGISLLDYLSSAVTPLPAMATTREIVAKLNVNSPFMCSSVSRITGQLWSEAPGA